MGNTALNVDEIFKTVFFFLFTNLKIDESTRKISVPVGLEPTSRSFPGQCLDHSLGDVGSSHSGSDVFACFRLSSNL